MITLEEIEIAVFGASVIALMVDMRAKIAEVATTIRLCPNCPHGKE